MYTVVYLYTAVFAAVHGVYRPCTPRHSIAKVDSRNLLEGYYSNPIIRSLEIDLFTFSVTVTFWVTM